MARYRLYGLTVQSSIPLPVPRARSRRAPDVRIIPLPPGTPRAFRSRTTDWFRWRRCRSGELLVEWTDLFEFRISPDGKTIHCRELPRATPESLSTYLLAQVLSFSLLASGIEPIHGTAVEAKGEAVVFLGRPGYGKSTLGAAFLDAGFHLLTDDLVALRWRGGRYWVEPGVPRIKLFPGTARRLLPGLRGTRMNPHTAKQVLPLLPERFAALPVPLRAMYVLPGRKTSGGRIAIEPLKASEAVLSIVRNTFNPIILDRGRVARQFDFAGRLARAVPVRALDYPRRMAALPDLRRAIILDIGSLSRAVSRSA